MASPTMRLYRAQYLVYAHTTQTVIRYSNVKFGDTQGHIALCNLHFYL